MLSLGIKNVKKVSEKTMLKCIYYFFSKTVVDIHYDYFSLKHILSLSLVYKDRVLSYVHFFLNNTMATSLILISIFVECFFLKYLFFLSVIFYSRTFYLL